MIRIRKARLSIRPAGGFKDMGAIKRAGDGQLVRLAKDDFATTRQIAVSYTHLDVYKRQPLDRSRAEAGCRRRRSSARPSILKTSPERRERHSGSDTWK